ncbi:hypothetical protein Pyn_21305 [Prunus yedoensis var. nudiflora]|uniref:Uncharacterized protein n=1 Tax=Prunus yedoensis var. nudiflora TaxID=2094558 RepID=A0A314Y4X4_PRUYE|nr:hypothetical protein Pyn_21305 [Prunus yedoensis var. nudiflora]
MNPLSVAVVKGQGVSMNILRAQNFHLAIPILKILLLLWIPSPILYNVIAHQTLTFQFSFGMPLMSCDKV